MLEEVSTRGDPPPDKQTPPDLARGGGAPRALTTAPEGFFFLRAVGFGPAPPSLKHRQMPQTELRVDEREGEIIIYSPEAGFCAVYTKLADQRQLILRRRTQTDDYELLARAWKLANDKARELGWIV